MYNAGSLAGECLAQGRHSSQATTFTVALDLNILKNTGAFRTPFFDMTPKQFQQFAVLPARWYWTVLWLEGTNSLSPLSTSWSSLPPCICLLCLTRICWRCIFSSRLSRCISYRSFRSLHRCRSGSLRLRSPVVYIPVVLVHKQIVLL